MGTQTEAETEKSPQAERRAARLGLSPKAPTAPAYLTGSGGARAEAVPTGLVAASQRSPAPKSENGDAKENRVTELMDFLNRVLPWPKGGEPGFINLHWLIPAPRNPNTLIWIGKPTRTVEEFLSLLKWVLSRPTTRDVYFCLSLQSQTGKNSRGNLKAVRNKGNALLLKAIWLDIDVKPPPKGYATLEEALDALTEFANAFGLPPPSALVGSGGGLHVYWSSDKPLTPDEWQALCRRPKGCSDQLWASMRYSMHRQRCTGAPSARDIQSQNYAAQASEIAGSM